MQKIKLKNGRVIGNYCTPYIVAELNSSHNGDIDKAKEMILRAKKVGCDCVKLQSWSTESLYSDEYYKDNRMTKKIVNKFSLKENDILELCNYSKEVGIDFSSTCYSKEEVEFLVENCDVPYIKIASMELNNYMFLEYMASFGLPLILSTGMGTLEEIKRAVDVIEKTGNKNICILHCVSKYPALPEEINLNNILMLKNVFPQYPIGYSDHTSGFEVPAAAVALGSAIIERHFTLDKNCVGMDNQMATEPDEMEQVVKVCHSVYNAMGNYERVVSEEEMKQRIKMRRSVVAKHDLKSGTKLQLEDIEVKRPGNGIPADKVLDVVGQTLTKDIDKGFMIQYNDIK